MDWANEQICRWLTAVGLWEYVQVFRGMFVKLGITGKVSRVNNGNTTAYLFVSKETSMIFRADIYVNGR
jgi:hypothetical protein